MANVTKPSTVLRCFAAYSDSKGCQEYLYDLCKSNDRLTTYLFLNKELDESIYLEMLPAADTSLVVRSLAKPLTDRMVKEVARQSALLSRQTLFEVSAHGGYLSESSFRYLLEQSWLTEDLLEFVIKSCELPDQLRLLAKERFARFPKGVRNGGYPGHNHHFTAGLIDDLLRDQNFAVDTLKLLDEATALEARVTMGEVDFESGHLVKVISGVLGERSYGFWDLFFNLAGEWQGSYGELIGSVESILKV